MSIPVLAASPKVEGADRAIQTVGTDARRLKTFCELMKIDEQNEPNPNPVLEARMDKLLDELGTDFKEPWDSAEMLIQHPRMAKHSTLPSTGFPITVLARFRLCPSQPLRSATVCFRDRA
jgi:hypothetical protein